MKKLLAAIVLAQVGLIAHAQDAAGWGKATSRAYAECSMVGAAQMLMGTVGPEHITQSRACADEQIDKAKAQFAALPPQKKPAADAAMKDYFAAWIASMKALPSLLVGSRAAAQSASTAARQRLDEMWARFEIEGGV